MYSVGREMVLAIGDLAGATVVTLLAPRRVCPSGSLWTIEIEVAVTGRGDRARAMACPIRVTRRVRPEIPGDHSLRKQNPSPAASYWLGRNA